MLKLLFLVISSLLVWSSARVLDSREYSFSQLSICGVSDAQLSPGTVLDIKSPNFDYGSYSINTRCQVTLKSGPENLLLTFDFLNIDIELEVGACSWDSLCINGVKLCGVWAQGSIFQYILPANSDFTLDFKTDYVVNHRGFDILVSASLYNNETVNITYGGVGTSREALQFQLLTLANLNYQDRCGLQSETSTGYPGAPWTNETTAYFQYTTNYPWNYDSTSYYQYTTYYPWYYESTSYYQYSTGYPYYYETSTYNSYSTYYPYTTGNPYYNPYTPVASAFPSKDYVASLVQQVIQQLNSERYSQEQASLLLTQLLRYLGY